MKGHMKRERMEECKQNEKRGNRKGESERKWRIMKKEGAMKDDRNKEEGGKTERWERGWGGRKRTERKE